jgi:hypothetical protein
MNALNSEGRIHYEKKSSLFVACLIALFSLSGCQGNRDERLERQMAELLIANKNSSATFLDLAPILGDQWVRACIQGLYIDKDEFERIAGRQAPGFHHLDRNYAFWIFYKDGSARWFLIDRNKVMDLHPEKGSPCTTPANPKLYFGTHNRSKKYFLSDKG